MWPGCEFGNDITCCGIGRWLGADGPGLAGSCCINGGNWGCGVWDDIAAFNKGTLCPTGWKCWGATGINCCCCGAGTKGRNCKITTTIMILTDWKSQGLHQLMLNGFNTLR